MKDSNGYLLILGTQESSEAIVETFMVYKDAKRVAEEWLTGYDKEDRKYLTYKIFKIGKILKNHYTNIPLKEVFSI